MEGRIIFFLKKKGYGFIKVEGIPYDIYFSKKDIIISFQEKKIMVNDYFYMYGQNVKFDLYADNIHVENINDTELNLKYLFCDNKVCAKNIELIPENENDIILFDIVECAYLSCTADLINGTTLMCLRGLKFFYVILSNIIYTSCKISKEQAEYLYNNRNEKNIIIGDKSAKRKVD